MSDIAHPAPSSAASQVARVTVPGRDGLAPTPASSAAVEALALLATWRRDPRLAKVYDTAGG